MSFSKRKIALMLIDISFTVIACLVFFFLYAYQYPNSTDSLILHAVIYVASQFVVRLVCGVYRIVWRYATVKNCILIGISDVIACVLAYVIDKLANNGSTLPPVFVAGIFMLSLLLTEFSRLEYKNHKTVSRQKKVVRTKETIRCGIVGAGYAGIALLDEITVGTSTEYEPVCFFDNDSVKIGNSIQGLKIYDLVNGMQSVVDELSIKTLIIAIPSCTAERRKELSQACIAVGCDVKFYDFDLKNGNLDGTKLQLRDVNIADLLGRDQIKLDLTSANAMIKGKTVMVTGGGGSIGSELCRQIASHSPKTLVIVDIYENNAYEIQQELVRKYGNNLDLKVLIASVRDKAKLNVIFERVKPDIVFHAAAHKHVPLMEVSPDEAVKNNVFGTYNVATCCEEYGLQKMILISTDKAVNPTNCMGATKRMCEMIIQSKSGGKTEFAAVRFGNVLGSNGSVIPLFRNQIAEGGPVTLTDKRITRFFMTIPEATQLVLEAGAMAKGGEIFVLDMGKPVKILDLAENLITLSGYKPYVDIDIVEVGLRPGEKLYEELLMNTEGLTKTDNAKIFIEPKGDFTRETVEEKLMTLKKALATDDNAEVISAMKTVVPTYFDNSHYNDKVPAYAETK